ncbi:MAG: hypothetical protein WDN72_06405 [Alphaproteobacteria bacterium]
MRRIGAILLCLAAPAAQAQSAQPFACQPTPKVAVENYPGADRIPYSNDLLQQNGKSIAAQGQELVLHGRVFDSDCLPVAGATVELWQNDPFGNWTLAAPADLATPDAVFAGAGRATTDIAGRFTFITAFPAALKGRAPHVDLRVLTDALPVFGTQLYFNDDQRNGDDPALKKLSLESRQRVMLSMHKLPGGQGLSASIDLVIPGKASYNRY